VLLTVLDIIKEKNTIPKEVHLVDTEITRYEINEHGELPVSYGRYVRYEDFLEYVRTTGNNPDYSDGWDDGYKEGYEQGAKYG